jgi:hypothetical protein
LDDLSPIHPRPTNKKQQCGTTPEGHKRFMSKSKRSEEFLSRSFNAGDRLGPRFQSSRYVVTMKTASVKGATETVTESLIRAFNLRQAGRRMTMSKHPMRQDVRHQTPQEVSEHCPSERCTHGRATCYNFTFMTYKKASRRSCKRKSGPTATASSNNTTIRSMEQRPTAVTRKTCKSFCNLSAPLHVASPRLSVKQLLAFQLIRERTG